VFEHFDAPALAWAVGFACELYARPEDLASVRRTGMERDFSWRRSGIAYERLYRRAIDEATGSGR
jgi:starch synthase